METEPSAPLPESPGPQPSLPQDSEFKLPVLGQIPQVDGETMAAAVGTTDDTEPPEKVAYAGYREFWVPLVLLAATCLSTFWVGSHGTPLIFEPREVLQAGFFEPIHVPLRNGDHPRPTDGILVGRKVAILGFWRDGFTYMVAVMAILLAHEMGHFLQAVRYRVPASLPFFIPMPFGPLGTMGAVIGMQGTQANRKELFDIGISGPIAGLMVALPVAWIGMLHAQPPPRVNANDIDYLFQTPLIIDWMLDYLRPDLAQRGNVFASPLLRAGWVGMLITGLNMLPVSQLDGGHVAYALFRKRAHLLARAFILVVVGFIVVSEVYGWIVMLFLVLLIGIDHPPTTDDTVPLGWPRRIIGVASLLLPVLCLPPNPLGG